VTRKEFGLTSERMRGEGRRLRSALNQKERSFAPPRPALPYLDQLFQAALRSRPSVSVRPPPLRLSPEACRRGEIHSHQEHGPRTAFISATTPAPINEKYSSYVLHTPNPHCFFP
jgi:hypothetical protein